MKYYIKIADNGLCSQAPDPELLGSGLIYEVHLDNRPLFHRMSDVSFASGHLCCHNELYCKASPHQKTLDTEALLGYIREEAALVEASGLAPGLFDQQLLELRTKKTSLAAQLKEQYPEKRALSISINESVGINDVVIEASGNEPE